jgi:hypothetical protein
MFWSHIVPDSAVARLNFPGGLLQEIPVEVRRQGSEECIVLLSMQSLLERPVELVGGRQRTQ